MAALDRLTQYPFAHIGAGKVTMLNEYPVQPAQLMAAKGWSTTIDMKPDVVFVAPDKAHLVLRSATRVRADGSPIETISAFYALTRTIEGWKLFALSDIAVPA
jgi:hypothetical protein